MDPEQFKEAYQRLQDLDERLNYRVRPRDRGSLRRPGPDQLVAETADPATYTLEVKEILNDLFLAIAAKPGEEL